MELSAPLLIGVLLFVWTVWAVLFWGSIALIERHNPYNKFKWALLWSAAEIGVSIAIGNLGFGGLGLLLAWLGFLIRLLLNSYELGLLHAIGVVIVTVVGPYFVFDAFDTLLASIGSSETMLLIMLYGVPAVVFAVWLWPRAASGQTTNLPPARIEKIGRKRAAAAAPAPMAVPVAAARVAPVAVAAAPVAPAVAPVLPAAPAFHAAPPVSPPASPISPPAADSPRDAGEPSFLR